MPPMGCNFSAMERELNKASDDLMRQLDPEQAERAQTASSGPAVEATFDDISSDEEDPNVSPGPEVFAPCPYCEQLTLSCGTNSRAVPNRTYCTDCDKLVPFGFSCFVPPHLHTKPTTEGGKRYATVVFEGEPMACSACGHSGINAAKVAVCEICAERQIEQRADPDSGDDVEPSSLSRDDSILIEDTHTSAANRGVSRCPTGHRLSRQRVESWNCDGCRKKVRDNEAELVFGCRTCDYDLCRVCYKQNKTTKAATSLTAGQSRPPKSGSASSKKNGRQGRVGSISGAAHGSVLKCQAGHRLALGAVSSTWDCNRCSQRFQKGSAPSYMCRVCDYDVCSKCALSQVHPTASTTTVDQAGGRANTGNASGTRASVSGPTSAVLVVCPQKHNVRRSRVRTGYRCDGCEIPCPPLSFSYGCRMCNFDLCAKCFLNKRAGAPTTAAAPSTTAATKPQPAASPTNKPVPEPSNNNNASGANTNGSANSNGNGTSSGNANAVTSPSKDDGVAEEPPLPPPQPAGAKCPQEHELMTSKAVLDWMCDMCLAPGKKDETSSHGCRRCDYDVCGECLEKLKGPKPKPAPKHSDPAASKFSSAGKGRCLALFIGINYFNTKAELRGCVNDVRTMMKVVEALGFHAKKGDRRILVDDAKFAGRTGAPTKRNIIDAFKWMCGEAKTGDTLFVHYSGHGSQTEDLDGDESDGYDETLVPVDYRTAGQITDDVIFETLCRHLPEGVRLTCVCDCCHSGSMLDLSYEWRWDGEVFDVPDIAAPTRPTRTAAKVTTTATAGKKREIDTGANKQEPEEEEEDDNDFAFHATSAAKLEHKRTKADVMMISGCKDDQTSSDVSSVGLFKHTFKGPGAAGGACTNGFVEALRARRVPPRVGQATVLDATIATQMSYGAMLQEIQAGLRRRKFKQIPMLSASRPIDMEKQFSLFGPLDG